MTKTEAFCDLKFNEVDSAQALDIGLSVIMGCYAS